MSGEVDYNDVAVFTEVVRTRGFTAAGKVLGLPTSAVSRRIARLEAVLGYRLLQRTTRRVGLTEAGRMFYERTAQIPSLVAEARRAIAASRTSPSGTIRMTAPPDGAGIIWALVSGFLRDHPDVDLELVHTLERVDLIEAGVDVALRGGPAPDSAVYSARQIFDSRILLAASPSYLSLRGTPQSVDDLEEHDGVCLDAWVPNAIRRLDGSEGPVRVSMRNRVRSNSLETGQRAAMDGLGIAPVLELAARDALERGALVEVLRGSLPMHSPMWVLAPVGRERSAAVRALVEAVCDRAERMQTIGAEPG